METVATRLRETRKHVAAQGDALVARTTGAGSSFLEETRGAGGDFLAFVGAEAKRWRRFVAQHASRVRTEVRGALSLPAIERRVLVRVDGTLRAMDERVRDRIAELSKTHAKKRRPRARKAAPRAKTLKSKPNGAALAA